MTESSTTSRSTSSVSDGTSEVEPTSAEPAPDAPAETPIPIAATAPALDIPDIFTSALHMPGQPEVSPDGAWLAYLYPGDSDAGADARDLWLSPTDGGDAHRLDLPFQPVDDADPDTGRHIRGPQWSPDGTTLALTGTHPDGDRTAIWLVTLSGEPGAVTVAEAPIFSGTADDGVAEGDDTVEGSIPVGEDTGEADDESTAEATTPASQADALPAKAVAEPVPTATTASTPRVVTNGRLLCDEPSADRSPRWSPDGRVMALVTTRDGVDQIGLIEVMGPDEAAGMVEPLTQGGLPHREPIWSRDGRFVAYTRQHGSDQRFADIFTVELATGEAKDLTGEKTPNIRHSLDWVPGRNLVAFVTRDGDWLGVAVVNVDNKAGWMITREAGDKWGHRFMLDEARLVYIRSEGFSTVLAERGLHGSTAVALDPGEGVVTFATWAGKGRVLYGFSAPQMPLSVLVQETSADAERTPVALPERHDTRGADLRHPVPFEYAVGPDEQFSGLVYQTDDIAGDVPGIVFVPEGPLGARRASFQRDEQALAASSMTVLTPVLHGATGFGVAVEDDLADFGDGELEATDLAAAGLALAERNGIDETRIVLVGHGYGGTLALIAAGSRPGSLHTVVAVDPVTDWAVELNRADRPWRRWVTRQYGLPLTGADRYALRTPETFAGVIDARMVLVTTAGASASRQAQFEAFTSWLDEVGIAHEVVRSDATTGAAALYEVGMKLARGFIEG